MVWCLDAYVRRGACDRGRTDRMDAEMWDGNGRVRLGSGTLLTVEIVVLSTVAWLATLWFLEGCYACNC
jgi:hypothetical protein